MDGFLQSFFLPGNVRPGQCPSLFTLVLCLLLSTPGPAHIVTLATSTRFPFSDDKSCSSLVAMSYSPTLALEYIGHQQGNRTREGVKRFPESQCFGPKEHSSLEQVYSAFSTQVPTDFPLSSPPSSPPTSEIRGSVVRIMVCHPIALPLSSPATSFQLCDL